MGNTLELEVFDATRHTRDWPKTEADVEAIAAAYSATQHEAPVTLDHKQDGPAYGWVAGLRREGSKLFATLRDLTPDFAEALRARRYDKRSVELYRPGANAALDGKPYLRAVSFLGAQIPECKGLGPVPAFAAGDAPAAEIFEERGDLPPTTPKERTMPTTIEELEQQVASLSEELQAEKAKVTELEAEKAKFAEEKAKADQEATDARIASRFEELVQARKALPADRDDLLTLFSAQEDEGRAWAERRMQGPDVEAVQFGENGDQPGDPSAVEADEKAVQEKFAEARKRYQEMQG